MLKFIRLKQNWKIESFKTTYHWSWYRMQWRLRKRKCGYVVAIKSIKKFNQSVKLDIKYWAEK